MNSSEVVALAVEEVGLQGIPRDPACHECGATDMTVGRCDRCGRGICTEHDFIPGDWGLRERPPAMPALRRQL